MLVSPCCIVTWTLALPRAERKSGSAQRWGCVAAWELPRVQEPGPVRCPCPLAFCRPCCVEAPCGLWHRSVATGLMRAALWTVPGLPPHRWLPTAPRGGCRCEVSVRVPIRPHGSQQRDGNLGQACAPLGTEIMCVASGQVGSEAGRTLTELLQGQRHLLWLLAGPGVSRPAGVKRTL